MLYLMLGGKVSQHVRKLLKAPAGELPLWRIRCAVLLCRECGQQDAMRRRRATQARPDLPGPCLPARLDRSRIRKKQFPKLSLLGDVLFHPIVLSESIAVSHSNLGTFRFEKLMLAMSLTG